MSDGKVITPALSEDILEGITRRSILQMCKDMGIEAEDRPITKAEMFGADEMFLSGTGCQVAWVASVDKKSIGSGKIGPITEKLQQKFFAVVRGKDPDYSPAWCAKVDLS